jgi:hypothetical protein
MTTSAALVTARPEDRAATGAQAAVIVVCRKPGARQILDRELSKRYGADYQIVVCDRRSWRPGCGTCSRRSSAGLVRRTAMA